MRSKRRQTNLQLLNSTLEHLAIKPVPTEKVQEAAPPQEQKEVIEVQTKPKRGRGMPKKALINTNLLLTGFHNI